MAGALQEHYPDGGFEGFWTDHRDDAWRRDLMARFAEHPRGGPVHDAGRGRLMPGMVRPDPMPTPPPPDGWPSWAAYRRYQQDADGGMAPFRMPDPLIFRTFLDVESENA